MLSLTYYNANDSAEKKTSMINDKENLFSCNGGKFILKLSTIPIIIKFWYRTNVLFGLLSSQKSGLYSKYKYLINPIISSKQSVYLKKVSKFILNSGIKPPKSHTKGY